MKSEYPDRVRFDVAVLSSKAASAGANAWNLPVRIGIELKLWQGDQSGGNFTADREKLDAYRVARGERFAGVCVAFCHLADDWRLREWGSAAQPLDGAGRLVIPDDRTTMLVVAPPRLA